MSFNLSAGGFSDPDGDSFTIWEYETNATGTYTNIGNSTASILWNVTNMTSGFFFVRPRSIAMNNQSNYLSNATVFEIDNTKPFITINRPQNQTYNTSNQTVNATFSEAVDTCMVELNGANTPFACNKNTSVLLAEGSNIIRVWANDTSGNMNVSETLGLSLDTIPLQITVLSPQNTTYSGLNITLNFTTSETADSCRYGLNGINSAIPCAAVTFISSEGLNTIKVWANDTTGNLNVSPTVSFSVDMIPPAVSLQSPQNITYGSTTIILNFTRSPSDVCKYELDGSNTT